MQDIIGQPSRQMQRLMSKFVISVRGSIYPQTTIGVPYPHDGPMAIAQWGLDILGPFPVGTRQMKFLVVGIDYFTKWVEAEPLASITQHNVKNFVWKNIVCRFGVPRVLVSNNG